MIRVMQQMRAGRTRQFLAIAASGVLLCSLSACAQSERGAQSTQAAGGTMIFGVAGAPKNFDPIFNDDGESFRPIRQMYETLIAYKPGTADLEPALAKSWE